MYDPFTIVRIINSLTRLRSILSDTLIITAFMLKLRVPVDLGLLRTHLQSFKSSKFGSRRNPRVRFQLKYSYCSSSRVEAMCAPPVVLKDQIQLSEVEKKIFQQLLDAVQHYKLQTQLRVAGGWVRDKLLGKDCYDIDIALDNMLGREFCEKVKDYLGEGNDGYCVIQSNPDQSKHLETARMRVFGTWIDFVNLRSEKYAENSRIPEMEFGTATEDAYRRDLTINSLFYNINTGYVEDLTGRGFEDLKMGRIVTPLPPKATFLDDPLRVLRAIRFGARFGFILNENLKEAASDAEVREALKEKISRERIGHEIDLMVAGKEPLKAITWIYDLKLFWPVFSLPESTEPLIEGGFERACVAHIDAAWKALEMLDNATFSEDHNRLYLYSSLFFPLRDCMYLDKKLKKIPVTNHIFRNSLKLKASDADTVMSLHEIVRRFAIFIKSKELTEFSVTASDIDDEFQDVAPDSRRRVLAGLLLRRIKDYWRVALLVASILYPNDPALGANHVDYLPLSECELKIKVELFKRSEAAIVELGLDRVWELKPVLDGNAVMVILQVKGRQIGEWQQRLLRWQLSHPEGTVNEARQWLEESHIKRIRLQ